MRKLIIMAFCAIFLVNTAVYTAAVAQTDTDRLAWWLDVQQKDVEKQLFSLYEKAAKWTAGDVPQSLDQFPLWPKKMPEMFEKVMAAYLTFCIDTTTLPFDWAEGYDREYLLLVTNLEDIIPGIRGTVYLDWWKEKNGLWGDFGSLDRTRKGSYVMTDSNLGFIQQELTNRVGDLFFKSRLEDEGAEIEVIFVKRLEHDAKRVLICEYTGYQNYKEYHLQWKMQSDTPDRITFSMSYDYASCTVEYNLISRKLTAFSPYGPSASIYADYNEMFGETLRINYASYTQGQGVILKWNHVSDGVTYALYRRFDNKKAFSFVRDLNENIYIDKLPEEGDTVEYYIEAIAEKGYYYLLPSDIKSIIVR